MIILVFECNSCIKPKETHNIKSKEVPYYNWCSIVATTCDCNRKTCLFATKSNLLCGFVFSCLVLNEYIFECNLLCCMACNCLFHKLTVWQHLMCSKCESEKVPLFVLVIDYVTGFGWLATSDGSIRTFHSNQAYFMHFLTLSVSFTSSIHLRMLLKSRSKGNTSQAVLFCLFSSRTIPLLITSHWNAGEENTSIKRVLVRIPLSQVFEIEECQ